VSVADRRTRSGDWADHRQRRSGAAVGGLGCRCRPCRAPVRCASSRTRCHTGAL